MKRKKDTTPSYADEFYKGETMFNGLDENIPHLTIKYRGKVIQLKGAKVPTEDFTKFVRRGSSFVPVVCEQPVDGEVVYDLSPLLNVGIAEMVVLLNYENHAVSRDYMSWCHNLEFGKNWSTILDKAKSFLDESDTDVTVLSTAVRSSLIDGRFSSVRQIYRTLSALKIVNPQSYCMALMEAVRVVFMLMFGYLEPDVGDVFRHCFTGDSAPIYLGVIYRKFFKFGVVPYGSFFSKHCMSDCRGLGINLFCMFVLNVYSKFAVFGNNRASTVIQSRSTLYKVQESFRSCIGTDAIGRYLETGHWTVEPADEYISFMAEQAGAPCLDGNTPDTMTLVPTDSFDIVDAFWYQVAGRKNNQLPVGRGLCESSMMWCWATGLERRKSRGYLVPMDCYYATKLDIVHAFLDFAFSKRGVRLKEKLDNVNREELMKELMERVGAQRIKDRVAREAEAQARSEVVALQRRVDSMSAELESLKSAKKAADTLVAGKQATIDSLLKEVKELRAKVNNMYDLSGFDEDQVIDDDVSVEDMLKFVNQFRLIIVGGIDSMQRRMEDMGFNNFYIVASKYSNSSTVAFGDFFCICTKFVGHKSVFEVQAQHGDQLDQFFYFNGTNTEMLLRVCYDFMKSWFDNNGRDDNK